MFPKPLLKLSASLLVTASLINPGALSAASQSRTAHKTCDNVKHHQMLGAYNQTRLDLSKVLQHMADTQPMAADTRVLLTGYIDNLEQKRQQMPEPDPESDAFKNFDFSLGLTLTSVTLFLHSRDEQLKQRFLNDRDNPNSQLGQYLMTLNKSREAYELSKCS